MRALHEVILMPIPRSSPARELLHSEMGKAVSLTLTIQPPVPGTHPSAAWWISSTTSLTETLTQEPLNMGGPLPINRSPLVEVIDTAVVEPPSANRFAPALALLNNTQTAAVEPPSAIRLAPALAQLTYPQKYPTKLPYKGAYPQRVSHICS